MAVENDLDVFSVRLPKSLGESVRMLSTLGRRSRNSQIVMLLEEAVDLNKAKLTKAQKERLGTLKSS